jgi:hypothetical protein
MVKHGLSFSETKSGRPLKQMQFERWWHHITSIIFGTDIHRFPLTVYYWCPARLERNSKGPVLFGLHHRSFPYTYGPPAIGMKILGVAKSDLEIRV